MSFVDENIERIFFTARQFLEDALEQGNIPIQTQIAIVGYALDHLKQGDPVADQFFELAFLHQDNKVETRVSPDEKAIFQEILTRVENGELKV